MITLNEAPQINVHLVKSDEAPGGIGEPGTSCVMPGLTNAIYAASGRRIRKLPVGEQAQAA
jgi:isoquinoline 1-oxidoreductase beta subunit